MPQRTVFLCKLNGLFMALFALALLVHPQESTQVLRQLCHDPVALLLFSLIGLAAGLAMVLAHNHWPRHAPTRLVTLLGWIMLGKSLLVLLLPMDVIAQLYQRVWDSGTLYIYALICLGLGVYLAWSGFRAVVASAFE